MRGVNQKGSGLGICLYSLDESVSVGHVIDLEGRVFPGVDVCTISPLQTRRQ